MQELSKGAAQAGVAIDIARQLESLLEVLGATGKGLHEKTGSVKGKLPEALVKKLRFVASVRNKLAHEDGLMPEAKFSDFSESGKQAIKELGQLIPKDKSGDGRSKSKPRKKVSSRAEPAPLDGMLAKTGRTMGLGGLVFLAGFGLVFLLMLLGNNGPSLWAGAFVTNFLLGWYLLRRSRRDYRRQATSNPDRSR